MKILLLAIFILFLFVMGAIVHPGLYVIAGIILFFTLIILLTYKESKITLNEESLIVETFGVFNNQLAKETFKTSEIEYLYHEREETDKQMLFFYPLAELFFPSSGNRIHIRLKNGEHIDYPFYGSGKNIKKLIDMMPNNDYYKG